MSAKTETKEKTTLRPLAVWGEHAAGRILVPEELFLEIQRRRMMKTETTQEKIQLRPLGEQVLIRRDDAEEKSPGGIVLPDSSKEKTCRGKAIAIGTGLVKDDGTVVPMQVAVGDRVVLGMYAPQEIEIEGTELLLVKESNIFCVIEGKE